ncbi:MAG: M50 family metallopeptidase [Clostridia bacterium]|nr:M50 family metallopeptidase [Clostridia bacterium]
MKNIKNNHNNGDATKIFIHPITFVFVVLSLFVGLFWLCLVYFLSLLLHEYCHAVVAKRLGYRASKIVLYPIGALLFGETDEFYFKDEILVAFAGPLANLSVVILVVFLWWLFPELYNFTGDLVVANLSLALFNMLPVYPMDGGRILLALLSRERSRKEACKIVKLVSIIFSLSLFVVFVLSCFFEFSLNIGVMSIVMFISAVTEDKNLVYKRFSRTDTKKRRLSHGLKKVVLAFSDETKLSKVFSKIDNFAIYEIEVYDKNLQRIKTLGEKEIETFALRFGLDAKLKEICGRYI